MTSSCREGPSRPPPPPLSRPQRGTRDLPLGTLRLDSVGDWKRCFSAVRGLREWLSEEDAKTTPRASSIGGVRVLYTHFPSQNEQFVADRAEARRTDRFNDSAQLIIPSCAQNNGDKGKHSGQKKKFRSFRRGGRGSDRSLSQTQRVIARSDSSASDYRRRQIRLLKASARWRWRILGGLFTVLTPLFVA